MDLKLGLLIGGWIFVLIWIPLVVLSQRKIHPKALFTLFFAELWERFSFYGMRALLILYMTKVLFEQMAAGEADEIAYGIYGAYGALVYGAPVIGGMLADRILGFRKAIILGGVLMAIGHFTLAIEGIEWIFYAALAFIVVGNGFFKPNISSFLGTFYEKDDPRKDGAFTIFYMGVNIGAFLAPLTCGYLGEEIDWFWGFSLAGAGMLLGLLVFWGSFKSFGDKGLPPEQGNQAKRNSWLTILGSFLVVPLFALGLGYSHAVEIGVLLLAAGVIIYLVYNALTRGENTQIQDPEEGKIEGQRLLVVVVLFFFHTIFWALFEQAGGSLTLFADRVVDRVVMGTEIPTSIFQSLNPLYIMLLAPVFSWIWVKLNKSGKEPRTPIKFVLGLLQLALGFGVIVLGAQFLNADGKVPLIFLVVMYLLHTMGELSISPVGLSLVTKLSPAKIVGFVMGAWFLSISLAHALAGELGKLTAAPSDDATSAEVLGAFSDVYMTWGVYVVGGAAVLLFVLSPLLKKWMHGVN